jgi:hypothetical protein
LTTHNERRREAREALHIDLVRVAQVVSQFSGVDPAELKRPGSRHPARAALVYLARQYTVSTNAELVPVLGVSRPESIPNFTRRFQQRFQSNTEVSGQLRQLEQILGIPAKGGK